LGPNGAGKSTLMKSLVASIPLLDGHRFEGGNLKLGYFLSASSGRFRFI
jgi:ATP-binding cassette subfamily F protein 3